MPKFYLDTEEKGKGYIVGWMGRLQKTRDGQNNRKGGSATPPVEGDDFSFTASGAVVEPSILQVQKPNDRLGDFTVVRASDASYTDSSGVIQTAPDNIARIDYTNGVAELLTEPQSTNLIEYSEDFSFWAKDNGATVSASNIIDPSGGTGAYLLNVPIGVGAVRLSIGATETQTRTIYARTVSGTGKACLLSYNANADNLFDLTEDWQRFEINGAISTAVTNFYASDGRKAGVTLSEFLVWGAQLEDLPYATSYIPTNGSTVTRLQDQITDGANVNVINSEEGVMLFEGSALVEVDTVNRYISLNDGTGDNRIYLNTQAVGDLQVVMFVGGVIQFNETYTSLTQINNYKIAFKWKLNDLALWINGVELYTDSTATSFIANTLNTINFSHNSKTNSFFFGRTRELKCYNRALTDEELEQITTL